MAFPSPELVAHLKQLYHSYRHTADIDARGLFFSPNCMQVCRPEPSWAAKDRATIIHYVRETAQDREAIFRYLLQDAPPPPETSNAQKKNYYTIRPLTELEFEFGTDEMISPIGLTPTQLRLKAQDEGWVGMRVDMWEADSEEDRTKEGLAVKVQYWWRKEGQEWFQILHDIHYLAIRDGTEGVDGQVLE